MIFKLIIVFLSGMVAGFINVNAGGGSLLTLPVLIFIGLPPSVANGTNRIAILMGALTATAKLKKSGYFDWKFALSLSVPALIGAVIGSSIVVGLPDRVFNIMLSGVMVMVLIVTIVDPAKRWKTTKEHFSRRRKILASLAFFFVGFYGGFIQVGVGFVIITALSLITGFSLVRINSLKVFVIAVYSVFALSVFGFNGKIDFSMGLILAAGTVVGAWLGSVFAVKKGDKWIRGVLIVAVIAMALKLSGLLDLLK